MRRLSSRHCIVSGSLTMLVGVAAATSGLVAGAGHARADDDPGSGLSSYNLTASAGGIQFFADAAVGEPGTADGGIPYSTASTLYGPTDSALSSIAWPGAAGGELGSLLLVSGIPTGLLPLPLPLPPPPAIPSQLNPYLPLLNDPIVASTRTGDTDTDVDNNSIPGGDMIARIEPGHAVAEAQLGGTLNALTGGSGGTRTLAETQITGPTSATATAESDVLDVSLPLNVVKISSITSTATATTSGTTSTVSGSTVIGNATIAGIPVTIDSKGVHVKSTLIGLPLQTLVNTVDTALKAAGIQIYVGIPVMTHTGAIATYNAGDVVVTLPKGIILEIGGSQVAVQSSELPSFDDGGSTLPVISPTFPDDTGSTGVTSPPTDVTGPSTDVAPPVGTGTTTPPVLAATPSASTLALPSGLGWGWILLVVAGGGLVAAGLRRLPDRVLAISGTACNLGDDE